MAWSAYRASLASRPFTTNVLTAVGTMFVGDSIAQAVELKRGDIPSYSAARTAVATGWSGFIFTPTFQIWFRFLDRIFPGAAVVPSVKKVLANQIVLSVPINAAFLLYTAVCERAVISDSGGEGAVPLVPHVRGQLVDKLPEIFYCSCVLWLPVNLANFMFVPQQFRVLPTILAAVIWSTYLSLTAHRAVAED